jgi:hypothetical protein
MTMTDKMNAKHTPGPWFFDLRTWALKTMAAMGRERRPHKHGWYVPLESDPMDRPELAAERAANRALVLAAPELLAALKAVASDDIAMRGFHESFRAEIRAAIAKAEGK